MKPYVSNDPLFRSLTSVEVEEFMRWARENYAVLPAAKRHNSVHHPVIQKEMKLLDSIASLIPGRFSFNKADWVANKLNTPVRPNKDDVELRRFGPGIALKTRTNPQLFGITSQYSNRLDGECIVIGHGYLDTPQETFVWTGTKEEFDKTWDGD